MMLNACSCGCSHPRMDDDEPFKEYWVECPECGRRTPRMKTREESVKAWNFGQVERDEEEDE